jgi:hypothetical protein
MRENVLCVSQSYIFFGMGAYENVHMGVRER